MSDRFSRESVWIRRRVRNFGDQMAEPLFNWPRLIHRILQDQVTDWHGIHGLSHWGRVFANGSRIAEASGANVRVVQLFAFFHDSKRINDGYDRGHGLRGAEYAKLLRDEFFEISDAEMELLQVACRDHTDGHTEADVTIQTCWDADRLDLGRVMIIPDPARLCTTAARQPEIIEWAHERARREIVSDVVAPIWHAQRNES